MVMMIMISSTSMTSISGVVLISIIGSDDSGLRTDALIALTPVSLPIRTGGRRAARGSEMKPIRA